MTNMASQSYRNRQEELKNKKPTLEMRSLKRFEKMKFANLHLERQCMSELSSLHINQERKLLDLRHGCHDLIKELQSNQYR
jgi:soluble cytochrome b562